MKVTIGDNYKELLKQFTKNAPVLSQTNASLETMAISAMLDDQGDYDFTSYQEDVKNQQLEKNKDTKETGFSLFETVENAWGGIEDWWYDVKDWWNKEASPVVLPMIETIQDTLESTSATITLAASSLVEGVLTFGEAIVDVGAISLAITGSISAGAEDAVKALNGFVTGEEWTSSTKELWEKTKTFVSKKHVTGWFDTFYENTEIGKYMMDKAYFSNQIRSVGTGVGYVAGIVALTIATFGVGGIATAGATTTATTATAGLSVSSAELAATAGIAGVGKGTQDAWADGASTGKGLLAGTVTGLWDGLQFFLGAKIGNGSIVGNQGLIKSISKSEFAEKGINSLGRILLDGIDGGAEGFVQPLIVSLYKEGYTDENGQHVAFENTDNFLDKYKEVFKDYGGWQNVFTNATIGSFSSAIGELFDIKKFFRENSKTSSSASISEINYSDLEQLGQDDIAALFEVARNYNDSPSWTPSQLATTLHNTFDSKYGPSYVDSVLDSIHIVNQAEWKYVCAQQGLPDGILGFVDRYGEEYIPSNSNMHTASHESLHKFSEYKNLSVVDAQGNSKKVTGIREFYQDGRNSTIANESLTDYLASKIDNQKLYDSVYNIDNVKLWNRIDETITKETQDSLALLNVYLENNTNYLRDFFNRHAFDGAYDTFALSMQEWYKNQDVLEGIVKRIEKSVYPGRIKSVLQSIFGGK